MEVVIDFEFLRWRQNEMVVKEVSLAGEGLSDSFRFEPPYYMPPHGSVENGLNWDDGHIAYHKLSAVLKEAVAGFPTSTATAPQSAAFSPHCLSERYSIWRTSSVLQQRNSSPDTAAPCPVTDIQASLARQSARIPPADQILRHVPSRHVTSHCPIHLGKRYILPL